MGQCVRNVLMSCKQVCTLGADRHRKLLNPRTVVSVVLVKFGCLFAHIHRIASGGPVSRLDGR